jgi:hypothetical protein
MSTQEDRTTKFKRRIDEYIDLKYERIKNKQCHMCGCDEIIQNDVDIMIVGLGHKDTLKEKTLSSLCKKCLMREIDINCNVLKCYLEFYEEYIDDIKNAIDRNRKISL